MKSSGRFDFLVILILMGIAGTAATLLWRGYREGARGTGAPVGHIEAVSRTTERKMARSARWFRADEASDVYNHDTLRTGPRSSLSVMLDDGTRLEIGPDSLLVIDRSFGTDLSLAAGTVRVTSGGGRGDVRLRTTEGQAVLTVGSMLVEEKVGRSRVVLEEGRARFEPAESDTANAVQRGAGRELPMEDGMGPTTTIPAATLPATNSDEAPQPPSSPVELEAGQLFDSESGDLRPLSSEDEDLFAPPVLAAALETPRLLSPIDTRLARSVLPAPVSLEWTRVAAARGYAVRILDAGNGSLVTERIVSQPSLLVELPSIGAYRWEVAALPVSANVKSGENGTSELRYTDPAGFTLELLAAKAPVLHVVTRAPGALLAGVPLLRWDRPHAVRSWELELLDLDNPDSPPVAQVLTRSFLMASPAMVGGRWRITLRSILPDATRSPPSTLDVDIPAWSTLVVRAPSLGALVEDHAVFSWEDPNEGRRYRFELAASEDFLSPLLSRDLEGRSIELPLNAYEPGRLYWRALLLDAGNAVLAASPVSPIVKAARLASPRLREPALDTVFDPVSISSLSFSWDPVPEAHYYELRIFRRRGDRDSLVRSVRIDEPRWRLLDFSGFSFDRFHWQVSAIRRMDTDELAQSSSEWSWFRFEQTETLAVPKITVMKKKGVY